MQEWRKPWLKIYLFGCLYTIWFVWVSVTVSATVGEAGRCGDGLTWVGVDPHSWQGTCWHSGKSLKCRNITIWIDIAVKENLTRSLFSHVTSTIICLIKRKVKTSQLLFFCKHFFGFYNGETLLQDGRTDVWSHMSTNSAFKVTVWHSLFSPLMKTAGRTAEMLYVIPRTCQGSMEPLGKTILEEWML